MPDGDDTTVTVPRRLHRALSRASWVVLTAGLLVNQVAQAAWPDAAAAILLTTLSLFFPLLLLRLGVAAHLFASRRPSLLLLLAAVAAWSLGSMAVNAQRLEGAQFPASGEWLFLLSYVGMAGYLMLDVDRRQPRALRGWLDIAVICGGTACLASLLLVMPIQFASDQEGISLLLALIYPLADLALALAVLVQALLQVRTDNRKSAMMAVAFLLLACADSGFTLQVSAQTYDFGNLSNALWGSGFALLVAAACRREQTVIRTIPRQAGTGILVAAGTVALAELALRPHQDVLAYYTLPPAVLTMATVVARMVLGLRDANRAAEAVALSRTDDLTKLPNRRAVRARLRDGLDTPGPLALMLLDLDGFKEINDTLGHQSGDTVLRMAAVRMREALAPSVMIARLGGDEFAILLEVGDEIELMETAHLVLSELRRPVSVEGIEMRLSGSIGITVATAGDSDSGEIMRRADVAMYQAKKTGLGVALYDAELDEFSRSRLQLAEELHRGIEEGQIEVWYQPQFEAPTLAVIGMEALVRWRHPTLGVISPVSFLPAARRAGLMSRLSDVVADRAVRDLQAWIAAGIGVRIAINCAPHELLGPTFLPRLHEAVERCGVPPDRLVLEITEESFLSDPQRTREVLHELRGRGAQVSIDDYGTGFSSLTYLRNLPVQELKIDRSLVRGVAVEERTRMIVGSTVQLAHALDMRIVAEGVENAADLAELVALGIDTVQGYHLARPMAPDVVGRWIRAWDPSAPLDQLHDQTLDPTLDYALSPSADEGETR